MEQLTEEVMIIQAQHDPEAFGRLYDMYYQPIFGYLYKRTGNREVAKDLTSETFFQALKHLKNYTWQGKPFKAWLYAIAVAQIGNYYRQRSKVFAVTMEECPEIVAPDSSKPDTALIEAEVDTEKAHWFSRVRQQLAKLSPKQQLILSLRYFSDQTIPEIAASLSMKEGTIKSHIHRALKHLQGCLSKDKAAEQAEPYVTQGSTTRTAPVPARVTS